MTDRELMQQALDALELVTAKMLDCRDQLAERGGRPTTNVVHQRLWDAAHKTYTDNAIPVAEALRARLAQGEPEPMSCSVRFPRHTPKHGEDWIIDPAFLLRVYHTIDPDAHYGFIPTMEEIETALLALEAIPPDLYTAPPQREWQGLTDEEMNAVYRQAFGLVDSRLVGDQIKFVSAIEAKLKEKNHE